jgi:predicted Fe-S protein YdhL (DUF1289 family)
MDTDFTLTSPCVGVCQINAKTKFCIGCWRTLREVAHWSRYEDEEKRAVLVALRDRQAEAGVDQRPVTRRQKRRLDAASDS